MGRRRKKREEFGRKEREEEEKPIQFIARMQTHTEEWEEASRLEFAGNNINKQTREFGGRRTMTVTAEGVVPTEWLAHHSAMLQSTGIYYC